MAQKQPDHFVGQIHQPPLDRHHNPLHIYDPDELEHFF